MGAFLYVKFVNICYNINMKIVVVSDSHGNKAGIDKIFNNYQFDYLIFLGDGINDLGLYVNLDNVIIVKGNCDFLHNYPEEKLITLGGVNIFVTHGHRYGVKSTLGILVDNARMNNATVALYGHTHKYSDEYIDGVRVINPGSLIGGRGCNAGFVILDIQNGQISAKHVFL